MIKAEINARCFLFVAGKLIFNKLRIPLGF